MEIVSIEKQVQVVEVNNEVVVEIIEKETQVIEIGNTLVIYSQNGGQPWVIGEAPTGLVNGVNATFTTAFDFVPESVEVFIETSRMSLLDDYNTAGTRTINFYVSPLAGEKIRINYQRQ